MTEKKIAESIPHEYREAILLTWLPQAKPSLANEAFRILWEAYFVYVDPDGVKKADCQICLGNVLKNWHHLAEPMAEVEREYNLLEKL